MWSSIGVIKSEVGSIGRTYREREEKETEFRQEAEARRQGEEIGGARWKRGNIM